MNNYLLTQLADARHDELITDAREHRRARAARPAGRFHRRGIGRSQYRVPRA
jgi:hypothetical protein